ncbi:MAG: recombinase family protein [Desulfobacterales bacterium]|nr:recombinase family protein [Desulfobacterales bacterium]
MALVGYARVSKEGQELDLQINALKEAGCIKIFKEKQSGKNIDDRPIFKELLKFLRKDDVLIVWKTDRIGRSLKDLVNLVEELKEKGVGIKSTTQGMFDTTKPYGEMIFNLFGMLAQYERSLLIERTNAGLAAAKARGQKLGRKKLLLDEEANMVRSLVANPKISIKDICQKYNISRTTLYRYVKGGRSSATQL